MNISRQSEQSLANRLADWFADLVHTHVKADVTDLETITTTPTVNAVPKADTEAGYISNGWLQRVSAFGPASRNMVETFTDGKIAANLVRDVSNTSSIPAGTVPITNSETGVLDISFIPPDIPNSKLAQMATLTVKGNNTGGSAPPINMTAAQTRTLLNVADGANAYVHPNHSGDVTSTGDGATVIGANKITNTMLRDSAALSVIGNGTASSGDPADISTSDSSNAVLRESGGTVSFGTVATAGIADAAVTNAKRANMAQSTISGRASLAGTGVPTDLTAAQVRTIINVADGANAYVHPNHSGDVTSVADGAQTIANDAGSNAKAANMATATIKGRNTAGTGDPEDLATLPTGVMPAHTGDVTSLAGTLALTIAAAAVTNAKNANMANATFKARVTAGSGAPEDVSFSGSAFPGTAVEGLRFYRTDLDCLFVYTGAVWVSIEVYEISYGDNGSTASGTFFRQYPIATAGRYTSTYGEIFGFDVVVVGLNILLSSSTCTITVEDDGADVTNGAMSLSSVTNKQVETLLSSTIVAGSIIGVKCTSGTATGASAGRARFRRVAT